MQEVLTSFLKTLSHLEWPIWFRQPRRELDLNGNNLNGLDDAYQQTLEAGVFVASLPLAGLSDGGSVEAEEAAEGTMATREGLITISEHLSQLPEGGGLDPVNYAMYDRLTTAFQSSQPLAGVDATFYEHELIESSLMDAGMDARAAHLETLSQQGIQYAPGYEAQLYHSTVIQQFPTSFSRAAQAAAGVH